MIGKISIGTSLLFGTMFFNTPENRKIKRYRLASTIADKLGGFRLYKHSLSWGYDIP